MRLIVFLIFTLWVFNFFAQSIRKNYKEMTQSEKENFVEILFDLRDGIDLIDNLASFHNNNFSEIHFNLPENPDEDVFLAWHRAQFLELEHAIQSINSKISIPYWNWIEDRDETDQLWDNGFLGQFNDNWNLGRTFNNSDPIDAGFSSHLPLESDINSIIEINEFLNFSNTLERGVIHSAPHIWIGGIMATGASPRDPAFYLHHGMVDKLWQNWVEKNNISNSANIYQANSLPRYDGTFEINGETLPLINPNNLVDSRDLGVFYAENMFVSLNNYSVTNNKLNNEHFYYQFTIQVENNFDIPVDKSAIIESATSIILKDGFISEHGSETSIIIDREINNEVNKSLTEENFKDFSDIIIRKNAYKTNQIDIINVYPNPANNILCTDIDSHDTKCEIKIYNIEGKLVSKISLENGENCFNIKELKKGVYILEAVLNGRQMKTAKFLIE